MTRITRTMIGVAALTAGYAALALVGFAWATVGAAVSPVWPASGLAVAALLLIGLRLWPGVLLGSLLASSLVAEPHPAAYRLLTAAGDTLAVVVAVWLLRRVRFDRGLRRPRDVLWLIALGGVVSGLMSGGFGIYGLVTLEGLSVEAVPDAFLRWLVGDLVGVITVTPVILTWARPEPLPRDPDWWAVFLGLLAIASATAVLAFVRPSEIGLRLLPWHVAPLMIVAAFLLDARAATAVAMTAAALALFGSQPGGGAFAELREGQVLAVQQYVMIMNGTAVLVAVMVETLRRARTAMENEQVYLATAENEARLRLAQEAGQVGTWDWDVRRNHALCSETLLEIFGWPLARPGVSFDEWLDRVHPEDRERVLNEIKAARRGSTAYTSEYRILLPSGEVRFVDSRARLFYGADARVRRVLGVVVDITERKEADERQRLLMREVDHRAKNALAVVQAVVRLTKAETQEAFASAVEGRIQAIARAHNLLAASRWTGASLRRLAEEEIEPYQGVAEDGGARVRIDGPEVLLEADSAQPLALVLHELVTNAAKHGALSAPGGVVDLRWSVDPAADLLRLSWTERGGPSTAPPSRGGFGSTLVKASVERQLHGELRNTWRKSGLHCEIDVPLQRAVRAEASAAAAGDRRRALLLVEDEALIGLDMKQRLEALGWTVIGPIGGVDEALRLIESEAPAAAVLDVNLGGEATAPVARRLADLHVPFAFSTGYGDYLGGAAEFDAPVLVKPVTTEELRDAFDRMHVAPDGATGRGAPPPA